MSWNKFCRPWRSYLYEITGYLGIQQPIPLNFKEWLSLICQNTKQVYFVKLLSSFRYVDSKIREEHKN